jgi:hypothetical protein
MNRRVGLCSRWPVSLYALSWRHSSSDRFIHAWSVRQATIQGGRISQIQMRFTVTMQRNSIRYGSLLHYKDDYTNTHWSRSRLTRSRKHRTLHLGMKNNREKNITSKNLWWHSQYSEKATSWVTKKSWSWGWIPGWGKRVSFLSEATRTGSGAHPAFNAMATRGSFPGDKAVGKWRKPLTFI